MPTTKRPAYGCALLAFAGAVFCTLNATKNFDIICVTAGCEIFKDISVYGISLWWVGTALFLTLALLNIFNYRKLALSLALFAVIADLGFLLFMTFTAPCVPCLIFAAILFILFLMQSAILKNPSRLVVPVLIVWALFFTPNIFSTVNEQLGTWAISGPEQPDVQVYFSPSCPSCKALIPKISKSDSGNITYYPVVETEADIDSILIIQDALKQGTSMYIAFNRSIRSGATVPDTSFWDRIVLQWNLFRNKSKLASIGVTRIPVLITNGVPSSLLSPTKPTGQAREKNDDAVDFGEGFSGCTEGAEVPCD